MKIAFASGKGGTGKTLFATALARYLAQTTKTQITFLDLDVEVPDARLFLPGLRERARKPYFVSYPQVDQNLCRHCGLCARKCNYGAITVLPSETLIFEELCQSCMRCLSHCPAGALSARQKKIGQILAFENYPLDYAEGLLEISSVRTKSLIQGVKKALLEKDTVIMDCPPGTTCPMVESVRDADLCILIGEDSPFGLHDASLAAEVLSDLGVPFALLINKRIAQTEILKKYARLNGYKIIAALDFNPELARLIANGEDALTLEDFKETIAALAQFIEEYRP